MNEKQAIDWLKDQLRYGIKPGLERVELLLDKMGRPEKNLKIIHIAGTNGKGSTLSFLKNMIENHGYSVGTFTSPYIEVFNERISINGQSIPGEQLVHYVELVKPLCDEIGLTKYGRPTEFEIVTCIALKYFQDQKVDYAIFEAGLGGRMDSTNIISPILSIITMIGLDHKEMLGDTLEEIAYEKAGIIKPFIPIITNEQKPNPYHVIQHKAELNQSPIHHLKEDFDYEWMDSLSNGEVFKFKSNDLNIDRLTLKMSGKHQIENATLAIYSFKKLSDIEGFSFSIEKIITSIEHTTWVGRFEFVNHHPTIVLDGAHNLEAVEQLIETINSRFDPKNVHLLISIIQDKPIDLMLEAFKKHYNEITLTPFNFKKSYSKKELLQKFHKCGIIVTENWKYAVNEFRLQQETDQILVITGSLYFVSEVRNFLMKENG
ncbi:bifunctional folylpolyglutamate synthase/dihydrofolate synthase [Piscibacillus halophilus]|uniref:bifunctional folylpolyglutamate synthase/dihydrofolate synthase n=1 Tax=Piscibacillus halophilus TaxID=571933 RepID=UPI00240A0C80|nr:folylpolyglutamate synthase/dihydrofolate synthase family protein [Piscibacillus halophilus]